MASVYGLEQHIGQTIVGPLNVKFSPRDVTVQVPRESVGTLGGLLRRERSGLEIKTDQYGNATMEEDIQDGTRVTPFPGLLVLKKGEGEKPIRVRSNGRKILWIFG